MRQATKVIEPCHRKASSNGAGGESFFREYQGVKFDTHRFACEPKPEQRHSTVSLSNCVNGRLGLKGILYIKGFIKEPHKGGSKGGYEGGYYL